MAYDPKYDSSEKSAADLYNEELKRYQQFIEQKSSLDQRYYEAQISGLRRFRNEQEALFKKTNEQQLREKELQEAISAARKAANEGVEGAADVELKLKKELQGLEKYYKTKEKLEDKFNKKVQREKKKEQKTEEQLLRGDYTIEGYNKLKDGKSVKEKLDGLVQITESANNWKEAAGAIVSGIASLSKALDKQIDQIAGRKTQIDTRLYGLSGSARFGSHWDYYSNRITGAVGISPFVKQEQVVDKLVAYIEKGIAYNVDQRAFLGTISDQIATTFDAANGTLLQIVRIQQSDSTAARLGMEASLNKYLNAMYQSTEYLSDLSKSVTSSIYEATSLMNSTQSIGFEYQIQKWLGSLYSVGMSQSSVQGIASALGALGSGNVSSLANNQYGNLLVMAASRAGLSYSDLLIKGLDQSNTNKLMQSMVEYLAEIASSNKVVQSQYASVFGVATSDIRAAQNLVTSVRDIAKSGLDYSGAMNNLYGMADSMWQRNSLGNMLSNVWENTKYSMSAGIASNPALYAI